MASIRHWDQRRTRRPPPRLKSVTRVIITDQGQQMGRWVEHYSCLYSRDNTVGPSALDTIECMAIMEELDVEPAVDELSKAISSLATGKAPGKDSILPDLIKHCKISLLQHLHKVLCQCWREGAVPQNMRDAKIVTLCKNKGDRSNCNNCRGIFLLTIVGKVYARVLLIRLRSVESSGGPCTSHSSTSPGPLTLSAEMVFLMLSERLAVPKNRTALIESFHPNMNGTVQFNGNISEPFNIRSGFKQGCVLAPTLYEILFALLLRHSFGTVQEGIYLLTRSDGRFFNLDCLKASAKVREALIRDMSFADDAVVMTHTQRSTITDNLSHDAEIGKAAATVAHVTSRVWTNPKLTVKTKMTLYNACVHITLVHGSEVWTIYVRQEKRPNYFHLRSFRRMFGISWQDKMTNTEVLSLVGLPIMYTLLRQRRLRWLVHV
ncbi:uncharacterized protein LOC143037357 [Oratosquilla oratoria]|uniref:uncharacterized protein LOC143037357 n=1 Tax=Oratosquilla oratoria TaxID=337810 RepID=UPI003F76EF3A